MASSRNEIRVGAVSAASALAAIGDRVPAGRRWNLNIIATNPTAGALTLTCSVLNKHHQYDAGRSITFTSGATGSSKVVGDVHPNAQWLAYAGIGGDTLAVAQMTPPTVISSQEQKVSTGLGLISTVKFSPDGNWIAVAGSTSPFLKIYAFNELYGIGLAVSDPASLPNSAINGLSWHPAGTFIACSYAASNVLSAWPWAPGFGTKVADSSAGAGTAATARTLAFRPQGDAIVAGFNNTPFIAAWPFTNAFGTKVANPTTTPAGSVTALAWAPGGGALAYVNSVSTAFNGQLWSSGFSGTAFSLGSLSLAASGACAVYAVDDYAFVATAGASQAIGSWWNPLGIAGTPMSITAAAGGAAMGSNGIGILFGGAVLVFGGSTNATIIMQSIASTPAVSGGIANICSALSIAAGATRQLPGYVMNEGERLVISGSGALDVYVSAVEVTL